MTPLRLMNVVLVNLKLCLLEVFSNKTRSIISSLGIFLGAASLLVNMTFIRAMDADVKRNMDIMGGLTLVTIRERSPENEQERVLFTRSGGLTMAQAEKLRSQVPSIAMLLPQQDLRWKRVGTRGKHQGAQIFAVSENHLDVYNYQIDQGTQFRPEHFLRQDRVCIVGPMLAERLFGRDGQWLGESLVFDGRSYTVIGILKAKDKYDRRGRECLIPFTTYQRWYTGSMSRLGQLAVKIDNVDNVNSARRAIEAALLAMHRGINDFTVEVNADKMKEMEAASLGMRILLTAIAIISLSVGSISIMNIMFAGIGDRIREIGVRKALGARRSDLFAQFVFEAVLLSAVGGVPGIVLGASITLLPQGTFPFNPQLLFTDYLIAVAFVGGAGLFSGLFPAFKASGMEPVEALRY